MDRTRRPPVPRIGGVAIALGGFTALALVGVVFVPTGLTLLATTRSLGPVMAGTLAMLLLGVVDDMRPVPAWVKFTVQVAVAAAMYAVGVRVGLLSLPFGPVDLGPVLGAAVTVLWLVGITNAFNLLDGADGVAAGSAFFAATAVFLMSRGRCSASCRSTSRRPGPFSATRGAWRRASCLPASQSRVRPRAPRSSPSPSPW
jgi:UDP-GlcNAc:undecaprenyl-phosphate GlcNAc-1-phosphate transferase